MKLCIDCRWFMTAVPGGSAAPVTTLDYLAVIEAAVDEARETLRAIRADTTALRTRLAETNERLERMLRR